MGHSINISLTNELRAFIDSQCGDGTDYATPSEFLRDIIRDKKRHIEAAALRDAVIEGYRDFIDGRFVEFNGSIKKALAESRKREKEGW